MKIRSGFVSNSSSSSFIMYGVECGSSFFSIIDLFIKNDIEFEYGGFYNDEDRDKFSKLIATYKNSKEYDSFADYFEAMYESDDGIDFDESDFEFDYLNLVNMENLSINGDLDFMDEYLIGISRDVENLSTDDIVNGIVSEQDRKNIDILSEKLNTKPTSASFISYC